MEGGSLAHELYWHPINATASGLWIFRFWQNKEKKMGLRVWTAAYS